MKIAVLMLTVIAMMTYCVDGDGGGNGDDDDDDTA